MIFRQLIDYDSHTYSYLIGCDSTFEALIIDPVVGQQDKYLKLLKELNLKLVYALDTHVHADHITALGQLREQTGCMTVMGAMSQAECVSKRLNDGDVLGIGEIQLVAHYTPGHTDDSFTYQIGDMLFTGDTLLIRSTGRTDFQNGDAKAQFDSLFNKLLLFPDQTRVYPGHDYNGMTMSTIGEEKKHNPRLQFTSQADYAAYMSQLDLPNPKLMDIAVSANLKCGIKGGTPD